MRSLMICHHDAPFDKEGLVGWLASFSEVVGVVIIDENSERKKKRVKRELKRVGKLRFADVMAFRLYYKLRHAARDAKWEQGILREFKERWPMDVSPPILQTHSPNSDEALEFIREAKADIAIARCKFLLKKSVFSLPSVGTFVMHPGICPEYRNSHGGFWALAQDDVDNVGTTLLKIDDGIDTGPVYGYYTYDYNEVDESHIVIQQRTLIENLDDIAQKLKEICQQPTETIDTTGRGSSTYGQPWMSRYLWWKFKARLRRRNR